MSKSHKLPRVALVGRINAGKSTLFNTLTETAKAIVSPTPGTTRDLNYSDISWRNKSFTLVDTGGLDAAQLGQIEFYVQQKAFQAIDQAYLIIYIIDGRLELTLEDRKIAKALIKNGKKILLVINKVDSQKILDNVSPDFHKLGLGEPWHVSAISGRGTGDMLDKLVTLLPTRKIVEQSYDLKLSIIGKTNVGKSSILNALLGEERVIVTPYPHTTREPYDTRVHFQRKDILLVDTAGMRKKRKLHYYIEKMSVSKTLQTIKRSDVSLIVTEVSSPLSSQDQVVAQLALDQKNSVIIVANKWDLIEDKSPQTLKKFLKQYRSYFTGLDWVPIVFVSAKKKIRMSNLLKMALEIYRARQRHLTDLELSSILRSVPSKKAKPSKGKKAAIIYQLEQTTDNPPSFSLRVNHTDRIHQSYLNQLEKKIRSRFGFSGTPINISLQKKE